MLRRQLKHTKTNGSNGKKDKKGSGIGGMLGIGAARAAPRPRTGAARAPTWSRRLRSRRLRARRASTRAGCSTGRLSA